MHPDLPHEQAYFDRALALRDRQQADLARAPSLAANPKAAVELRKRVSRLGLADPDEAIAFGRIEASDDRWYIGKGAIWGDDNDLVVVNWQAPIAAAFYTATPDQPEGLDARRLYRCSGNQIREIEDLMFREVAEAIVNGRTPEPVLTDSLLDSLGSARSGELSHIVATIQAAQYDVISQPLDQLLVVQGGPGTGKTVVGLHRVSWLLFNRRDRLEARDVLIVGPNPAFVRYISSVLPSLGDEAVVQLPLHALGPRVRIGRVDPPALRRLKGDRRLLRVILRGLRNRQQVDAGPVELRVGGRRVELDGARIATRARQLAGRPHNEAYRMLRAFLVAEVSTALARVGAAEVAVQGETAQEIDNHLARVWPSLTPQAFLVDLLSSRRQLLAAGAGTLSDIELDMLALPGDARVSTWQWSADDVPLLDAAEALLNGVVATYEHIVVDEAQDLSPLQLESIRRRSRAGSITVLGDLAQGTSPWAHESWDEVVAVLRHERVAATTVELEYGYRLPAEVHEVAMRLLPEAAPGLACPEALRSSGHEVDVVATERPGGLVDSTVAGIRELVGEGIVGVITPPTARSELVLALDEAGIAWTSELRPTAAPVVVLTPDEAKGLEFDCVIVVEPAAIIAESAQGVRALFVALTRCTNRLALVHDLPLPPALGLSEPEAPDVPVDTPTAPVDPPVDVDDRPEHADEVAGGGETGGAPDGAPSTGTVDLLAVARAVDAAEPVDEGAPDDAPEPVEEGPSDDAPAPVAAPGPVDEAAIEWTSGGAVPDVGEDTVAMPVLDLDGDAGAWVGEDTVAMPVLDLGDAEPGEPAEEFASGAHEGAPRSDADKADDEGEVVAERTDVDEDADAVMSPDTVLASLGDLDRDIARAVAHTVAERLAELLAPSMLPLVADELDRALRGRPQADGGATARETEQGRPVSGTDGPTGAPLSPAEAPPSAGEAESAGEPSAGAAARGHTTTGASRSGAGSGQ